MRKIRAIYIGDVRFDDCPVFDLNEVTDYFEMNKDKECKYSRECVEEYGSDFLIFEIENDSVRLIKNNASIKV